MGLRLLCVILVQPDRHRHCHEELTCCEGKRGRGRKEDEREGEKGEERKKGAERSREEGQRMEGRREGRKKEGKDGGSEGKEPQTQTPR